MMNRAIAVASSIPKSCFVRRLNVTPAQRAKVDLSGLKRKQALFQEKNDIPVYLKGGALDYFFYYGSLVLLVFSVSTATLSTYKLITKK